jgi:hypothetical protein
MYIFTASPLHIMHSKPISVTLLEKSDGDVDFLEFVFLVQVRQERVSWYGVQNVLKRREKCGGRRDVML